MHKPVLLENVLLFFTDFVRKYFANMPQKVNVLDCTFGRGGHLRALFSEASQLGVELNALAVDQDADAIDHAHNHFSKELLNGHLKLLSTKFGSTQFVTQALESPFESGFNVVLADFGVSSPQLDQAERGFSFRNDGLLDMRMGRNHSSKTAAHFLESLSESELEKALRDYGEERLARRIAHAICEARQTKPFTRTHELATLCERIYPPRHVRTEKIHPATRTFQALRILVNDELGEIERLLSSLPAISCSGPSLHMMISFHSLEDRPTKKHFRASVEMARHSSSHESVEARDLYRMHSPSPPKKTGREYDILKPFPSICSEEEGRENSRSRSAKLRAGILLP